MKKKARIAMKKKGGVDASLVREESKLDGGEAKTRLVLCCVTKGKIGPHLFGIPLRWYLIDPHEVVKEEEDGEKIRYLIEELKEEGDEPEEVTKEGGDVCLVEQPWLEGPSDVVPCLVEQPWLEGPSDVAPCGSSTAVVGSKLFVLGGYLTPDDQVDWEDPLSSNVSSCKLSLSNPAYRPGCWMKEKTLIQPRRRPYLVPFGDTQLYAFGSHTSPRAVDTPFGEVFNLKEKKWIPLDDPPVEVRDLSPISFASLDHHTSPPRIILRIIHNSLLISFDIHKQQWRVLPKIAKNAPNPSYFDKTVVMKGILYTVSEYGNILAYDLHTSSWFDSPVIMMRYDSDGCFLVYIGEETLCYVSFAFPNYPDDQVDVYCIKFKVGTSGGSKKLLRATNVSTTQTRSFSGVPVDCLLLSRGDNQSRNINEKERLQNTSMGYNMDHTISLHNSHHIGYFGNKVQSLRIFSNIFRGLRFTTAMGISYAPFGFIGLSLLAAIFIPCIYSYFPPFMRFCSTFFTKAD